MTDAAEPPMEEILASIRRIIAEEPVPTAADPDAGTVTAEAEPSAAAEPADVPAIEGQARATEMERAAEPAAAGSVETDVLVSEAAEAKAGSAFDRLASTRHESERSRPGYVMPEPGRSLEDVTRDLLAPLLKAWLDEHLPAIVEARVDEEVTRIARGRVR